MKQHLSDSQMMAGKPEPLLSLLTVSHPLLSTAINGSLSAYTCSKSYSPRFKYGAEFVERHIGSPVASTVESVGRRTGVEGGVRWWLGSRRASQGQQNGAHEDGEGASKRRKVGERDHDVFDIERGLPRMYKPALPAYTERRPSVASFEESLPAYDDNRSPTYEAHGVVGTAPPGQESSRRQAHPTWHSRLILSTSGFGVAMSEESLRSLKYCLAWLRWANVHLGNVVVALKGLVDQCDHSRGMDGSPRPSDEKAVKQEASCLDEIKPRPSAQEQQQIAQSIQVLKKDVLQTLKGVIDVVSTYAGGALPDHARSLVRHLLTSLPQRFRTAFASNLEMDPTQSASVAVNCAHRVVVLAQEGLDMMTQVSGVVDGTIASAEDWCDRLGRKKRSEIEGASETSDHKETLQVMPVDAKKELV